MAAALAALFGLGAGLGALAGRPRRRRPARPAVDAGSGPRKPRRDELPAHRPPPDDACVECHIKGVFEGTPTACESCHWDRQQDDRYKLQAGCPLRGLPYADRLEGRDSGAVESRHDDRVPPARASTGPWIAPSVTERISSRRARTASPATRRTTVRPRTPTTSPRDSRPTAPLPHKPERVGPGRGPATGVSLRGRHAVTLGCGLPSQADRTRGRRPIASPVISPTTTRTTEPNHRTAGFPTDCVACHGDGAVSWSGRGSFNHNQLFALKGAHATLDCYACHAKGYNLPTNCYGCHAADYNATTDPNHKSSGYSTDCVCCHGNGAVSWDSASINHNQFFVLQGRHATLDCTACHAKGYNLPTDCYGCHAADYSATTEPNHKASGFPTTCETCHLPRPTPRGRRLSSSTIFPSSRGGTPDSAARIAI